MNKFKIVSIIRNAKNYAADKEFRRQIVRRTLGFYLSMTPEMQKNCTYIFAV